MKKPTLLLPILALAFACSSSTTAPPPAAAPWEGAKLAPADVPSVFVSEWRQSENRDKCALVAPASLGAGEGATARRANFSGGWAVAFDKPGLPGSDGSGDPCATCGRSAFGIAGTGADASAPSYDWPLKREWADSSSAGWGLEGGTGPGYLAYVRIAGQECLYNVWSHLGREHLEYLIDQLRFVDVK